MNLLPIVVVQKPIQPMRVETTKTRNNKLTLNYNTCCFCTSTITQVILPSTLTVWEDFSTSHSLQDYFLAVPAFFSSNITKFLLLQIILCNKQARTWNQRSPFSDTPYLWGWGHIVRLKVWNHKNRVTQTMRLPIFSQSSDCKHNTPKFRSMEEPDST